MEIFKKEHLPYLIIVLLLAVCGFLFGQYYIASQGQKTAENTLKIYVHNEKILAFTKLFVTKVLKASGPVSVEDQLKLESAARDIDSKPIYDQWKKFINSGTALEAQSEVKNLLDMLVSKIEY